MPRFRRIYSVLIQQARLCARPLMLSALLVAIGVTAQAQDIGDEPGQAQALSSSSWENAALDFNGDIDVFELRVSRGYWVTFETSGSTDTICVLMDRYGREILTDDDSGSGTNCRLQFEANDSPVYVGVRGYSSSTTGPFQVRWSATSSSFDRPSGPSASRAVELREDREISDSLTGSGDENWYELDIRDTVLLRIETEGDIDVTCTLHDRNRREITEDDDGGWGRNCRIETIVTPGEYLVMVEGYSSSVTGPYTIEYETERPRDDHSDSRYSATDVRTDREVSGLLTAGDEDWFELDVRPGEEIEVYTSGDTDTRCTLYDSNGRELDDDDDGGWGQNCEIEFEATERTYYVKVEGYSYSTTGRYTLHVED